MEAEIDARIAELPVLNKAQLLPIWAQLFPSPPPPTLRKELMVPILAYRIQEKSYGGLSHRARQRLKTIAAGLGPQRIDAIPKKEDPNPGTRLVRVWRRDS